MSRYTLAMALFAAVASLSSIFSFHPAPFPIHVFHVSSHTGFAHPGIQLPISYRLESQVTCRSHTAVATRAPTNCPTCCEVDVVPLEGATPAPQNSSRHETRSLRLRG